MAFGPVNLAGPWQVVIPACCKLLSLASGKGSVNVRLNRIKSGQSIAVSPSLIPFPRILRCESMISAAPTSTFFGSQPRNPQVPPYGRESAIATCQPAARHCAAAVAPASPVPITMRSNDDFTAPPYSNCPAGPSPAEASNVNTCPTPRRASSSHRLRSAAAGTNKPFVEIRLIAPSREPCLSANTTQIVLLAGGAPGSCCAE